MKHAYLILRDVERARLVKTRKCCHFPPQPMAFSTVSLRFPTFSRNRKTFFLSFSLHGRRRKFEEWRGAAETVQRSASRAGRRQQALQHNYPADGICRSQYNTCNQKENRSEGNQNKKEIPPRCIFYLSGGRPRALYKCNPKEKHQGAKLLPLQNVISVCLPLLRSNSPVVPRRSNISQR
jgi:hypothetical protein